jgi:2-octaprenyl-3-methyl-6-methoxy-1,4-benzoquinol hydroxylase
VSARDRLDAIVVGGGVVGAACALVLARGGLAVSLVEAAEPSAWSAASPDLRVFAFAPDNAGLLASLGVWDSVRAARVQPYRRMRVWDAAGGGELAFDADAHGRSELGWIVENALLQDRLWAALPAAGVRIHGQARVEALEQDDAGVRLRLQDGTWLQARVAIAADGARSTLRELAGIGTTMRDYGQRGVVGYVATEQPPQDTAWQRFLPGGPLAVLPFADGRASIVWSLPAAEAARVLALDDDAFGGELARAFDNRLGAMRPRSARAGFPLRRQLADACASGRVLVLGDAAHVVHPLAGQGVNLGLRDVASLGRMLEDARRRGADWSAPSRLARWARTRRSENAIAAHAFDAIHRGFTSDTVAATLLRGPLLGLAGRLPPLTHALWRRAAGL